MKKVILVAGEICAGKDTYAQKLLNEAYVYNRPAIQIDLGELVREKFKTKDRVFDNNLEPYFIEKIQEFIDTHIFNVDFIITGVRQVTLLRKIVQLFDEVEYIYLVAPRDVLKKRYLKRAAIKDKKISFEDAIRGDQTLGMKDLQHYLLTKVECNFIKTY